MFKPMTDQEAKEIIAPGDEVMQRAGIAEKAAAKDKEIADNMRAYWIERADGAEPFMGGDD